MLRLVSQGNDSYLQGQINGLTSGSYSVNGGTINGSVVVLGNLSVVGNYVNLTVTNEFVNGSLSPSVNNSFDGGSSGNVWRSWYAKNFFGRFGLWVLVFLVCVGSVLGVNTFVNDYNSLFSGNVSSSGNMSAQNFLGNISWVYVQGVPSFALQSYVGSSRRRAT